MIKMQIYIFMVALSLISFFSFMDYNSGRNTEDISVLPNMKAIYTVTSIVETVVNTAVDIVVKPILEPAISKPVDTAVPVVVETIEPVDNSKEIWIEEFTKASIRSNVSDARKIIGIPKGIPLHVLHGWAIAHVLAFDGFTEKEKIKFCAEMSIEVLDNENIESDGIKHRLKQMIERYETLLSEEKE